MFFPGVVTAYSGQFAGVQVVSWRCTPECVAAVGASARRERVGHPEAVQRYVPWAKPPFYANSDEQTLMNDIIISSVNGESTYGGSTAFWELRPRVGDNLVMKILFQRWKDPRVERP